MSHDRFSARRASRLLPRIIGGGVALVIILLFGVLSRAIFRPSSFRQTVVIAGNPAHILSLNASRTQIILMDIPEDTVIAAVKGYGKYSVRSLIALDAIDTHHGELITKSISDAFGIPVVWHVVAGEAADEAGSVGLIRRIFSWGSIPKLLNHTIETSVPFTTWVHLVWVTRFLPADAVQVVDMRPAIVTSASADGSEVSTLDESKLDFVLQNTLYDAGLRAENLTVAVYNTTNIPGVGERASRQISRLGIQLVFVGNAEKEVAQCSVSGENQALDSKTAAFIRSYFHCVSSPMGEVGGGTGADLIVQLGTQYASQYK